MCKQHFQALNRYRLDSQHRWSQRFFPSLSRTCPVSMVNMPLMHSRSQSSQRDNHYTSIVLALMHICLENTNDRKRIRSRPCISPSNTPCNLDRLAQNSHSCTYSWSTLCSPHPNTYAPDNRCSQSHVSLRPLYCMYLANMANTHAAHSCPYMSRLDTPDILLHLAQCSPGCTYI